MLLMFYLLYQLFYWCIVGTFYAIIGVFWLGWFLIKGIYYLVRAIATTTKH